MGDQPRQELLRLHNARLRNDLNSFRGREVKTTGHGFLAVFDGATKAVRCAGAMIQEVLAVTQREFARPEATLRQYIATSRATCAAGRHVAAIPANRDAREALRD